MKFTLSWLKDHLETDASLEDICAKLNLIGLEVEEVNDPAERLGDFVIARVVEAKQHPDADKLRVCIVDFGGKEHVQVVCGAPNARTDMVGVFAASGTYIPGTDFTLSKAKIRGVESSGMLCSERELELSDDHEGVIDLPAELADRLGERFVDVAGLNDPTIEIGITPNRPDALGVRGVARDLAAAGLGKLKKEDKGYKKKADYDCPVPIELRFPKGAGDACPIFAGRYIRALKNGPSPKWLQDRLRAIGLRPINALVDVTNFITYDRARPLHVYDADKLKGTIHARLGKKGEKFLALDGKEYKADGDMTVIADDSGALGFGGIIGGDSTGCTQGTVNVLIESAYFDPVRTAMTGRRRGIQSDARYRFERGIDPQSEELGIDLATALILDICGGDPSRTLIAGKMPDPKHAVHFDTDELERLTGVKLKDSEIKKVLKQLGFEIDGKGEKI
ncbi:MAG: phenylalanine--tRNA ligase subunit beta, partial [Hyphomicrobiaceae bacterium]